MAELELVSSPVQEDVRGDVIFVHGLDGDIRGTWTNSTGQFWPEWVGDELKDVRVWSLGYEASSTKWRGGGMPLEDQARAVLARLAVEGIGSKPLSFVAHSLGGIIVKAALRYANDTAQEDDYQRIARNTRSIVFIAVPHDGSLIANVAKIAAPIARPTPLADVLRFGSPQLRDLHSWYVTKSRRLNIRSLCFYEMMPNKYGLTVEPPSGILELGEIAVPVWANHSDICKPNSPGDQVCKQTISFIDTSLKPEYFESDSNISMHVSALESFDDYNSQILSDAKREARLQYRHHFSDDVLTVSPNLPYLDMIKNGVTVSDLQFRSNACFDWDFPMLDIRLVNNTHSTIMLHECILEVQSSKAVLMPIPVFYSGGTGFGFGIRNEGWTPLTNCMLKVHVVTSHTESPELEYLQGDDVEHIEIDSIDNHGFVDLSDWFISHGINVDMLKALQTPTMYGGELRDRQIRSAMGRFYNVQLFANGILHGEYTDEFGIVQQVDLKFNVPLTSTPGTAMAGTPPSY
jgi:pimeloyl-ACP methyl ester carboxylesterase